MSEELKPCPLCGGQAKIESQKTIRRIFQSWTTDEESEPLERCTCGGDLHIVHHPANDGLPYDTLKCQECEKEYDPEDFQPQEAKPLTVEQLDKIAWKAIGAMDYGEFSIEQSRVIAEAIHATLPPDQSARIAELEHQIKFLEGSLKPLMDRVVELEDKIAKSLPLVRMAKKWCGNHIADDAPDKLAIPINETFKILGGTDD